MTTKQVSYDSILDALLAIDPSNFNSDELAPSASACINLISEAFKKGYQEIRDDLATLYLENEESQIQENELKYGHIDMYGDDKNTEEK